MALNSKHCGVTGFTPIELIFGTKGNSLGLSQVATNCLKGETNLLNLDENRSSASDNIVKFSQADSLRVNRSKVSIKPIAIGDYVFIKSEERSSNKIR